VNYYLYNRRPNTHPSWTLAVLAINQADADNYIRAYNPGMKRCGMVIHGKVEASCGAITEAATETLRNKNPNPPAG